MTGRFTAPVSVAAPSRPVLPDGASLLALERRVRHGGSGLQVQDLQGCWQLLQVWPRRGDRPAGLSGLLLRGLGARLEIQPQAEGQLRLCNAIRLGRLELRFRGDAQLVGSRPLLRFSFTALELGLGDRVWWRRTLPAPAPRRLPFFALIGRDPSGWLAARGRGGGLALWQLTRET